MSQQMSRLALPCAVFKPKVMKVLTAFFAFFMGDLTAYAAPSIPDTLRNQSVIFCTNSAGFSLNPQRADTGSNRNVVTEQIYDKLVEIDPVTHALKPALAQRIAVSEDGLSVVFHLRKDVAFQQTQWFTPTRQLTADDVVFSLNRMMGKQWEFSELTETEQASLERYQINRQIVDGTRFPYVDSTRLKNRIERVVALDPHTVKITLNAPYPALLEHLASHYAVILSKEYALQLNADDNLLQIDRLPVGTGAYQVESYVHNDHIRLVPNSHYWGKKANMANIIVDFSTSGTGRMVKFLNGECDVSAFPEPSQLSVLAEKLALHNLNSRGTQAVRTSQKSTEKTAKLPQKENVLRENAGANLAFLAFNFSRPAMQNVGLRQHIAQSINRGRLVRTLFYRKAEVAESVLPQALLPQTLLSQTLLPEANPTGYVYQPRFLAENQLHKWLGEQGELTLWVIDEKRVYNPHPLKMAELIRADLANTGLKVKVRQVSRAYLVQQIERNQADYDLILGGWLANNYDLDSFLFPLLSCKVQQSVTNLANWCNVQFDSLLAQAQLSDDMAEKKIIYQQIQQLLQKELPILPLVNAKWVLMVSPMLRNVSISPFGQVDLSSIKRINSSQGAK